ncbi:hypothetical protein QAD02_017450 [Eretmocerus hayati]|uniref:Uncharacterized protein n=1 Tax=Eretmocerus hayati TaxID=131215 RepID=A0ACC2PF26_9HYME|nr:hypothetical protein QAD02_017450 [Eretmocerus hayati]
MAVIRVCDARISWELQLAAMGDPSPGFRLNRQSLWSVIRMGHDELGAQAHFRRWDNSLPKRRKVKWWLKIVRILLFLGLKTDFQPDALCTCSIQRCSKGAPRLGLQQPRLGEVRISEIFINS